MGSARRQVLIEATVVEVTLNDDFQAGVDWSRLAVGDGWSVSQNVLAETIGATTSPVVSALYSNSNSERDISAAIKALDAFGDVSVMSSPKIMALNNQTSILKVVDNIVYFTQDIDREPATDNSPAVVTVENTVNTVPVGFVMNVTPYISEGNEIILNIRPTISRVLRFRQPPGSDHSWYLDPACAKRGARNPGARNGIGAARCQRQYRGYRRADAGFRRRREFRCTGSA